MIPSPSKRRVQREQEINQVNEQDEEEELFNGLARESSQLNSEEPSYEMENSTELLEEKEDEEFEADELEYMRLDTILEEDEAATTLESASCDRLRKERSTDSCDMTNGCANVGPLAETNTSCELLRANNQTTSDLSSAVGQQTNNSVNECDTTAAIVDSKQVAIGNKQAAKMQQQQQHQSGQLPGQTLPSTNRLISEHQARQQQRLFRALAERQKMLDELGADCERADLMTSAGALLTGAGQRVRRHRKECRQRRRAREKPTNASRTDEGVPLSAVDLSSMSDRMLDELLGHIASASSSSLSSNGGDSLDSSDVFSSSDDEDGNRPGTVRPVGRPLDAPNIVGVHEDERTRCLNNRTRRLNCRDVHKRSSDNGPNKDDDGDDDDNDDHELLLRLDRQLTGEPTSDSLSPGANKRTDQQVGSQLEHYFTSGLVNPHELSGDETEQPQPRAPVANQSVEEVLSRMLEALSEIGTEDQAKLNELLEAGFSHLEQLLNCSFAPQQSNVELTARQAQQAAQGGSQQQLQAAPAQKVISSQQANLITTMSKDSDYGSDTQSGDCFSQCADSTDSPRDPLVAAANQRSIQLNGGSSESPSPSSLTTQNSSVANCQSPTSQVANGKPALSPLALELSFKLADSLHRLAKQQAARRQQAADLVQASSSSSGEEEEELVVTNAATTIMTTETPKKSPMKSVVLLNGYRSPDARSPSVISCSSSASAAESSRNSEERNMTPSGAEGTEEKPAARRHQFKTRINICGGSSSVLVGEQSSLRVERVREEPKRQVVAVVEGEKSETKEEEGQQVVSTQQLHRVERRRSSLRRRPSFSGSTHSMVREAGAPRAGSPVPRPIQQQVVGEQEQERHKQQEQRQKQLQRALILAQKYNYSPAKLAASKLSSKLQLKDLTGIDSINGPQPLDERSQQPERQQVGRVQLDISYFAKSGSLTVHVLQCAQLAAVSKRRTTSNPYVKLYLLPDRSKSSKRKSTVRRNNLDPIFDEKFTFGPIQLSQFNGKTLWLSVWHKDRLGRNEFLGELLLPLAQVRQQLLASDLCQSTSARWYQLQDRFDCIVADVPSASSSAATLQKRNGSETGRQMERRDQQLELADKLNDFHMKAARLATAVAPPSGCQTNQQQATCMNVSLGPLVGLANGGQAITGQLFVALKFVPDNQELLPNRTANVEGELHVIIKEAHNIGGFEAPQFMVGGGHTQTRPSAGALPNPFCKCYLLASNGRRLAKQKTPQLKRTANPRWDHKCIFTSLKLASLSGQALEILMFNRDSILVSNNEFLGGIRLCQANPTASEQAADSASIASDNSSSVGAGCDTSLSRRSNNSDSLTRQLGPDSTRSKSPEPGALCTERESRLWTQMLARPNIWVYGELRLRKLPSLIAANPTKLTSSSG